MRFGDRYLQLWRMRMASPWIVKGSRVLDIGCHDGEFLEYLGDRIVESIGIDPEATEAIFDTYSLLRGMFGPQSEFASAYFDATVMLATLEHMNDIDGIAQECARILRPRGRVIVTVPSLVVDQFLAVLIRVRILDGMSVEQHHGLEPSQVPRAFVGNSFTQLAHKRFQLGLNHLYVFEKDGDRAS